MKLSIVTTLYQSAAYVDEFYRRVIVAAEQVTAEFEIIFVNDGSTDNSLETALELRHRDPRVAVVDLSRNFGHYKAIMTGLEHATGDCIFLIDVDLEEPPEILQGFQQALHREKADVAYGIQTPRHGPWLTRTFACLFYWIFNLLSDYPIPRDSLTARLMTRRYVAALLQFKEHLSNMIGLWELAGFKQVAVPVRKNPYKGSTTYTFRRRLAVAMYAITGFSSKPLRFIAYLGFAMTAVCACYVIYLVGAYFAYGVTPTGWTSLIVSIWLLAGVHLFCLGIISTYLAVVFVETKARPYVVIREVYPNKPTAVS